MGPAEPRARRAVGRVQHAAGGNEHAVDTADHTADHTATTPSGDAPEPDAPRAPLFPAEQADAEPLDDEAFFASLREAVSDQTPLGPRDEIPDSTGSYEDDDAKSGLFRRRR